MVVFETLNPALPLAIRPWLYNGKIMLRTFV